MEFYKKVLETYIASSWMSALNYVDIEQTRDCHISKVRFTFFWNLPLTCLFTCHSIPSYFTWRWLNRAGEELQSLLFFMVPVAKCKSHSMAIKLIKWRIKN